MAYRKTTLRRMSPVTRKLARLKNVLEEVHRLELDANALRVTMHLREKG